MQLHVYVRNRLHSTQHSKEKHLTPTVIYILCFVSFHKKIHFYTQMLQKQR